MIKQFIIISSILSAIFVLNACSVNWESTQSQSVDQMLADDGVNPVPQIPPANPLVSGAPYIEPLVNDNIGIQPNITQQIQQNESDLFRVGAIRFDQGRYEEAILAYNKVIEINPQNAAAWNNRGIALGLVGRYDDALESFFKATEINPSSADAWFNLGIAYDFFGEYSSAVNAYTRVLEINPKFDKAQINKDVDIHYLVNYY